MPLRKNIHNMHQGPPNPGFMQEKVQKRDFLKKPLWELNFFCCFRFLSISRRLGMLNWKRLLFCCLKSYTRSVWYFILEDFRVIQASEFSFTLMFWKKVFFGRIIKYHVEFWGIFCRRLLRQTDVNFSKTGWWNTKVQSYWSH